MAEVLRTARLTEDAPACNSTIVWSMSAAVKRSSPLVWSWYRSPSLPRPPAPGGRPSERLYSVGSRACLSHASSVYLCVKECCDAGNDASQERYDAPAITCPRLY